MNDCIHDTVRQLLELHLLEERGGGRQRSGQDKTDALIASLRARLPVSLLLAHDQMRAKGKRSVAEVRRGICSGCHLALGLGNVAALRRGEMRRCGHCGRYVYLGAEEPAASAPPPTRTKKLAAKCLA